MLCAWAVGTAFLGGFVTGDACVFQASPPARGHGQWPLFLLRWGLGSGLGRGSSEPPFAVAVAPPLCSGLGALLYTTLCPPQVLKEAVGTLMYPTLCPLPHRC